MIHANMPKSEWERLQAHKRDLAKSKASGYEDSKYTSDETAFLKEYGNGGFDFLRCFGLSIYDEGKRKKGRAILRALMKEEE